MKVWVRVLVSAGLLGLLAFVLPLGQVGDALRRLTPTTWLAVLGGFLAGHSLGVFKWRMFVNAGRGALRVREAARCYAVGLFANLCLPSIVGGDVIRAALTARATRRPEAAVLGGVLDRLTDIAALATLMAGGALASRGALDGPPRVALTILIVGGVVAAGILLPLVAFRRLARWPARLRRPIGRGLVGLRRLRRQPGTAVLGLVFSLTIQGSFILLNAWLGASIGIAVPLVAWFLVWPLAKLTALIPISLGGLAVRDATLASLLVPFGVPFPAGIVASLLWQTVLIAGGLTGGLVWLLLGGRGLSALTRERSTAGVPASPRSEPNRA